jgi:hypothetical protein
MNKVVDFINEMTPAEIIIAAEFLTLLPFDIGVAKSYRKSHLYIFRHKDASIVIVKEKPKTNDGARAVARHIYSIASTSEVIIRYRDYVGCFDGLSIDTRKSFLLSLANQGHDEQVLLALNNASKEANDVLKMYGEYESFTMYEDFNFTESVQVEILKIAFEELHMQKFPDIPISISFDTKIEFLEDVTGKELYNYLVKIGVDVNHIINIIWSRENHRMLRHKREVMKNWGLVHGNEGHLALALLDPNEDVRRNAQLVKERDILKIILEGDSFHKKQYNGQVGPRIINVLRTIKERQCI